MRGPPATRGPPAARARPAPAVPTARPAASARSPPGSHDRHLRPTGGGGGAVRLLRQFLLGAGVRRRAQRLGGRRRRLGPAAPAALASLVLSVRPRQRAVAPERRPTPDDARQPSH